MGVLFGAVEYTEIVAKWIFEECVKDIKAEVTFDMILSSVKEKNKYDIPAIFIVLDGGLCLGTASLFNNDLKNKPDLEPWLASLFSK